MGLFVVVTALAPVLALLAFFVDSARWLARRRRWVSVRGLAFLWVYLLGELWALSALLVTVVLPHQLKLEATFWLQEKWASWNLRAIETLFTLTLVIEGQDCVSPGPVIVLSRHASMVDTLLPATLITRTTGLKLRYVLKKELLVDPALDVAGNRLPNAFIDRGARDASERIAIRDLAAGLGPSDGILIYPEGTRFSESKLRRYQDRVASDETVGEHAGALRRVLPPRPGGTLALLDSTDADVVVLAHHGLEGLATVSDIWGGGLVGSRISVRMWRVPRTEIPDSRSGRVEWLYRLWVEIDDWVVSMDAGSGSG
jgi:1-acyl-sn-glycerol-3-phosphate acyltransferase